MPCWQRHATTAGQIRGRLDAVLRQDVLPRLARRLGRWAREQGLDPADDDTRDDLEAAALAFVLRSLFLRYAESTGEPAWDRRAHGGDLFAAGDLEGAWVLERAALTDAELAPALVAGRVDFSGLEIGHLGHIYEGLLSLRLSLADRDYAYDARPTATSPRPPARRADVAAGELLWLTNEGGRKGGGVYYTRTELVRHLVRGAVGPAFERHLAEVRELATRTRRRPPRAASTSTCSTRPAAAPTSSSRSSTSSPTRSRRCSATSRCRRSARSSTRCAPSAAQFGAGIEDTALLKRLVLKRCVYGVDLSPMGAEIAKVSLWLGTSCPASRSPTWTTTSSAATR